MPIPKPKSIKDTNVTYTFLENNSRTTADMLVIAPIKIIKLKPSIGTSTLVNGSTKYAVLLMIGKIK